MRHSDNLNGWIIQPRFIDLAWQIFTAPAAHSLVPGFGFE